MGVYERVEYKPWPYRAVYWAGWLIWQHLIVALVGGALIAAVLLLKLL